MGPLSKILIVNDNIRFQSGEHAISPHVHRMAHAYGWLTRLPSHYENDYSSGSANRRSFLRGLGQDDCIVGNPLADHDGCEA